MPLMSIVNRSHAIGCLFIAIVFSFYPKPIFAVEISRESAIVRAVKKISPAVVNISTEYEVRRRSPFSGLGMDPFFESFFKDFLDPGDKQRYKRSSLGSGVVIDGERGFILTNEHVIVKTGRIMVNLKDDRQYEAHIVGADPDSDLAVLRIDTDNPLPSIKMGRSDDLMIGETVIAIGNPFGFSNTVTTGVISAANRSIRTDGRVYHDFIQIDASINPGNSGGPLLNIKGELIGINTAIYAKAQGIGFAIPINKAKRIISDLIRFGEVVPAWIGLSVQDIDPRLSAYLKVNNTSGVIVTEVEKKSPARAAGIKREDIILALGGKKILSVQDYHLFLRGFGVNDVLQLKVLRKNKVKTFSLSAATFPEGHALDLAFKLLGVTVDNVSYSSRLKYKTEANHGVVILDLDHRAYLARIGAKPGDVIRQLGEIKIKNVSDFKTAVIKIRRKTSVVVLLQRGDQGYYITVKL